MNKIGNNTSSKVHSNEMLCDRTLPSGTVTVELTPYPIMVCGVISTNVRGPRACPCADGGSSNRIWWTKWLARNGTAATTPRFIAMGTIAKY